MKLFLLIIPCLLIITPTLASTSQSLIAGWHLVKSYSDNSDIQAISPDADLIMAYQDQHWLAISPSGKYTATLEHKQIKHLTQTHAGDALWIFSASPNTATFVNNTPTEITLHVKPGWNLVSFSGQDTAIWLSSYINQNSGIESIWAYDNSGKQWRAYSPIPSISAQIANDPEITSMETLDSSTGLWVKSTKNADITITNLPPFFTQESHLYTVAEKDMNNFMIQAIDPNGDGLDYTLAGTDADAFHIVYNRIQFKPINTKPKAQYTLSISVSDGTSTIRQDAIINIQRRYENDYSGEYGYHVGTDEDHHKQWYLDADHLNINALHQRYNGSSEHGAVVQIVEGGFDTQHPDLIANMDFSMAYDASVLVDGQNGIEGECTTQGDYSSHGTSSAGIVAARGYNGIGIRGVIPFAKLTGFKFRTDSYGRLQPNLMEKAWLNGPRANDITVSSNSWGQCHNFSTQHETILKQGSEILRDGKGRIYVFAAGNHRVGYGNCFNASTNLTRMLNNPYSIVVAAMGKDDKLYEISTPGPNILVSAYGKDIIWSTTTGTFDYASFSGTSAATPMVAGGAGLLLEACPELNYRDVKYLLAKHAIQVDRNHSGWIQNDAGHYYNTDYGFGKMNIKDAIQDCQNSYIPLPKAQSFETITEVNQDIPYSGNTLNIAIPVQENSNVEWVSITLDAKLSDMGEYEFILTSPAGTKIQLLHSNNAVAGTSLNTNNFIREHSHDETFQLSAVGFLDEESQGVWHLEIIDGITESNQESRLIKQVKLNILGY